MNLSMTRNTLLLALALATSACAQGQRTETSRMDWRNDGARLTVRAEQGVVTVLAANPAGRFGVQAGDRVLRVDGAPITQVGGLTGPLSNSRKAHVPVVVQRDGRQQELQVATAAWHALRPPATPRPPAPPSPPNPPTPPGRS